MAVVRSQTDPLPGGREELLEQHCELVKISSDPVAAANRRGQGGLMDWPEASSTCEYFS